MGFNVPKKGRTLSRNSHLPDRTSRTIDAVVPIIQQQNHHAIQAKGYPVYVYQRLRAGKRCPCCLDQPIQGDIYDDDGVASPSQLQKIIDSSRFSIEDYNPNDTMARSTRDVNNIATDLAMVEDEFDEDIPLQHDAFSAGACPICLGTGIIGGYYC